MDSPYRITAPRADLSVQAKAAHLEETFKITNDQAMIVLQSVCYDLETATSKLWDKMREGDDDDDEGSKSTPHRTEPVPTVGSIIDKATGTQLNPIDLTSEVGSGDNTDRELQQALALSLQQMSGSQQKSGISIEEEELSRAVEASIAANQENLTRLGLPKSTAFVDPINPHDRKRAGTTAVGLKNIGNTCWFSAVVQSLLHVPVVCERVLGYTPPPFTNGTTQHHPSVSFLLELQKLFALLLLSPRKYVDPSFVIQTFKEVFSKEKSGGQQDVNEFTHKLLEWTEEAFKHSLAAAGDSTPNPMVQLFTGHCQREGTNNGEKFQHEEDFGALHVQVHDHTHIHECLGAYTFNPEVQQEAWFTSLPPILVLSLSRFKYNQNSGQAEKVHDKLQFDLQLSMDRYLEANRVESRRRRCEGVELQRRMTELKGKLDNYLKYGGKSVSIMDALSLTLQFVREQGSSDSPLDDLEGEQAEKRARISLRPSPHFVSSGEMDVLEGCLNRWVHELNTEVKELEEAIKSTQSTLDGLYGDPIMNSTPYHLHAVLVHQGQASLGHYWAYVRKSHACLLTTPSTTVTPSTTATPSTTVTPSSVTTPTREKDEPLANTGQYDTMDNSPRSDNDEKISQQAPTDGMEMEGGAIGVQSDVSTTTGVQSDESTTTGAQSVVGDVVQSDETLSVGVQSDEDVWLKFNDVSVTEVSWADVQKESYGGSHNTSAYCLIYVNKELHQQFTRRALSLLVRDDLQRYVDRDATDFQTELADYDSRSIQAVGHIPSSADGPRTSIQPPSPESVGGVAAGLADTARSEGGVGGGAPSNVERSPEQMQVESPPLPPINPTLSEELIATFDDTYTQMASLYQGKCVDPRLAHVVTYAIHSGATKELLRSLVLEMIIQQVSADPPRANLRILAQKEFLALFSKRNMQGDIDKIRNLYNHYVIMCWNFIKAVKFLREDKWEGALAHSLKAYTAHKFILEIGSTQYSLRPTHLTLLANLRRRSLQAISDLAYNFFLSKNVQRALSVTNELLIPCMGLFGDAIAPGDEGILETIREKWCHCLNEPGLTSREQDQLGDLLTRMFDEAGKTPAPSELALPTDEPHSLLVELSNAVNFLMNQ
ncbi:ubiquitin carboxyl-terminal hydrolase 28-like [Halichondria panicea]|uniref:ubiquitin carboxyl-terminal hydrolase 28-like n=1 Tax=Halichondria panicea TaxID=6063 RepID=UPI00312B869F